MTATVPATLTAADRSRIETVRDRAPFPRGHAQRVGGPAGACGRPRIRINGPMLAGRLSCVGRRHDPGGSGPPRPGNAGGRA